MKPQGMVAAKPLTLLLLFLGTLGTGFALGRLFRSEERYLYSERDGIVVRTDRETGRRQLGTRDGWR